MGDVLQNHKRKAEGHRQSCIIACMVHVVRITRYPGFYFYTVFLRASKSTVTLPINRQYQALSSVAQSHTLLELAVLLAFQ